MMSLAMQWGGELHEGDMKASVFIATSLDGFIARQDGGLDWLPFNGGEPHGYDEFMATVDALVIGRKTFISWRAHPKRSSRSSRNVV